MRIPAFARDKAENGPQVRSHHFIVHDGAHGRRPRARKHWATASTSARSADPAPMAPFGPAERRHAGQSCRGNHPGQPFPDVRSGLRFRPAEAVGDAKSGGQRPCRRADSDRRHIRSSASRPLRARGTPHDRVGVLQDVHCDNPKMDLTVTCEAKTSPRTPRIATRFNSLG